MTKKALFFLDFYRNSQKRLVFFFIPRLRGGMCFFPRPSRENARSLMNTLQSLTARRNKKVPNKRNNAVICRLAADIIYFIKASYRFST